MCVSRCPVDCWKGVAASRGGPSDGERTWARVCVCGGGLVGVGEKERKGGMVEFLRMRLQMPSR